MLPPSLSGAFHGSVGYVEGNAESSISLLRNLSCAAVLRTLAGLRTDAYEFFHFLFRFPQKSDGCKIISQPPNLQYIDNGQQDGYLCECTPQTDMIANPGR